jgi:hypothetical protein
MTRSTDKPNYGFKILTHQSELDNLAGWVLEHPDRETGGDLFGFWTHSGSPAVQLVLGPGARARHEVASFYQDADHLQRVGGHLQSRYGLQHIGNWHSHHHLSLAEPSSGDTSTTRRVFDYTEFPRYVLFIANIRPDRSGGSRRFARDRSERWTIQVGAFLFDRDEPHYRPGRWVVLPDASPIAESARQSGVADRPRRPSAAWSVTHTTLDSSVSESRAPAPGWYTQPWGTAFLRNLDGRCRATFADCWMTLSSETDELIYALRAGQRTIRVGFPGDFPIGTATFTDDDRLEAVRDERPTKDAESFFERLLTFVGAEQDTPHVVSASVGRDEVREEPTDGMDRRAADPPGQGASDPQALLSEPTVAQPNKAIEDVPRRSLHD